MNDPSHADNQSAAHSPSISLNRKVKRSRQIISHSWFRVSLVPAVFLIGYVIGASFDAEMATAWLSAAIGIVIIIIITPESREPGITEADISQLRAELEILASANEVHRLVSDVNAELMGCSRAQDARERFASALHSYWSHQGLDLLIWEQGRWHNIGEDKEVEAPTLTAPVTLPGKDNPDLILDLSPAVDGQAAVVLRQARPQAILHDRTIGDIRYLAETLRGQLALSLRRVILYESLQKMGRIDPLTKCVRRWYGHQRLHEWVEDGRVLSILMIDIDHFKAVNDEFGHGIGDQVLNATGETLHKATRHEDLVARVGGEEFMAILPDTNHQQAMIVAERMRFQLAQLANLPCQITVSIGLACCHRDEHADHLIRRADSALYEAKQQGRDRICSSEFDEDSDVIRQQARQSAEPERS